MTRPVLIAGQRTTTDGTVPVTNPYSGEVIDEVPCCGPDQVDARPALALDR